MGVSYSVNTASTYKKIYTTTLSGNASSINISNIPQNFTDLRIVITATLASGGQAVLMRVGNGSVDSGSNYSDTIINGNGSSSSSSRDNNADAYDIGAAWTSPLSLITADIMNYSNSTTYKTLLARQNNSTYGVRATATMWRSTESINTLSIFPNSGASFASGTKLAIYGIAAANAPKATGGNIVSTDGYYWYHTFTSSGVFKPVTAISSLDYLVVAGGGGGGGGLGAGGGAGGLRSTVDATGGGGILESKLDTSTSVYAVVVGSGGAGGSANVGLKGSDSCFGSITSIGGGGGSSGSQGTYTTGDGGSGGGGGNDFSNGLGTPNQGFDGGGNGGTQAAGGGGGAGHAGYYSVTQGGGNGGAGVAISISGSSTYYAGGGGGSQDRYNVGQQGVGGQGGGGNGATGQSGAYVNGTPGTSNTGGGGGGGGNNHSNGASGGSGIVILRYTV